MKNAVSLALKREGKYLVVKRSEDDSYPGLWEFPGGGIDDGEDFLETAIREAKEETGLYVEDLDYVCEYDWSREQKEEIHVILLYSDKFSGDIDLSHEHSDFLWLSEDEIYELDYFSDDIHKFFGKKT